MYYLIVKIDHIEKLYIKFLIYYICKIKYNKNFKLMLHINLLYFINLNNKKLKDINILITFLSSSN